ncbi:MAG: type I-B CRISPR-associated endonuclease Cas1 [Saprospiraceae bacterium]|nr:type I-B CRISPR-associated endonuclease Cas1 [Saprospiraceae bacterium]
MKRSYYLFNPGRMSRKDNTLHFVVTDDAGKEVDKKNLPIETIENLYIFGSVDANSALYNFLGKAQVPVHFFDYYEHYSGSFMPKDYLLAGKMQVEQTKAYLSKPKRLAIAQAFIEGASFNMLKNLKYYDKRGRDAEPLIEKIEGYRQNIPLSKDVEELMGLEGNCRQTYYDGFDLIINDFTMGNRVKNPPSNEVNALISFGNALAYTLALDTIYHTQLNPTISFLHQPGARRYSLALDIAEIFKPIMVDRMIFKLLNKREIRAEHFDSKMNGCRLTDKGRAIVVREWDERLKETIKHRTLNKPVSYKYLVRLECYKLQKFILGIDAQYKPFKIWW